MKSSTKILSILAASSLVASIPVVLAQAAPPPPPPPPPAPVATPPAGGGGAAGAGMGRGQGGPGGFQDAPTLEEYATLNKALKELLSKDPEAAKVYAAHPNWAGPLIGFSGRGGNPGGSGRGRGGQGGGG